MADHTERENALFHQMNDLDVELKALKRNVKKALDLLMDARIANQNGRTQVVDEFIERAAGLIAPAPSVRVAVTR